jgi:hypothetical protein
MLRSNTHNIGSFSTADKAFSGGTSAPQAREDGGEAPLGRNTKFVGNDDYLQAMHALEKQEEKAFDSRRRNWVKHDAAARLLQGTKQDRVCTCSKSIAYGQHGVTCTVYDDKQAKWGGLVLCGNVWTCPFCSSIISNERGQEANKALEWSRRSVLTLEDRTIIKERVMATPMMMTLTARHGRNDNLEELNAALLGAKKMMFQSEAWRALRVQLTRKPVYLKEIGTNAFGQPIYNETTEKTEMPCLVERTRKTRLESVLDSITGRNVLKPDGSPKMRKISVPAYKVKVQKERVTGWVRGSGKVIGMIIAFEITHTANGGWHPHFHIVCFLDTATEKQGRKILTPLRKTWLRCLQAHGLHAKGEVGFSIDGAARVGSYVTKFGAATGIELSDQRKCLAEAKSREDWGLVQELTATHSKKSKKPGAGVTPWELLEQYAFEDEEVIENRNDLTAKRCGALFVEFAQAFHGKQQLQWSPGLKDLVGLRDRTDEEIIEESDADDEREKRVLSVVAPEDWYFLVSFTTRTDRNTFLKDMHYKTSEDFWHEFEVFLGRPPIREVDEARLAKEFLDAQD